jgi:hypothetical protein
MVNKRDKSKVAIVGFSESTRDLAPYADPDYEIWACNHLYRFIPRADRWFEIHTLEELKIKYEATNDWEGYYKWMQDLPEGQTIYMAEAAESIPRSVALPIEELKEEFYFLEETHDDNGIRGRSPRPVFKSTISYMVAMALREGFKTIALYGIDMVLDFEWGFQRHNLHYYIGWARGMGVEIIIPEKSALMKEADGMDLYAYDHRIDKYGDLIKMLQKRITGYDRDLKDLAHDNDTRAGDVQASRGVLKLLDQLLEHCEKAGNGHVPLSLLREHKAVNRRAYQEYTQENLDLVENMKQVQGHRDEAHFIMTRVGLNNRGEQL